MYEHVVQKIETRAKKTLAINKVVGLKMCVCGGFLNCLAQIPRQKFKAIIWFDGISLNWSTQFRDYRQRHSLSSIPCLFPFLFASYSSSLSLFRLYASLVSLLFASCLFHFAFQTHTWAKRCKVRNMTTTTKPKYYKHLNGILGKMFASLFINLLA